MGLNQTIKQMRVTLRLIFNRKKRLNHMGTALVEIVATLNGKRRYFTTNQLIKPNEWHKKKHETTISYINTVIAKQHNELKDFSEKWFVLHDSFTIQDFDHFKAPVLKTAKVILTFTDFFRQQLELEKTKIAFVTYRQQKTALNYFTKFRSKVLFSELNFALIEEYDQFLRSNELHQNTIHKRHRELKKYINLAIKHDHLVQSPYTKFKMWKVPVDTMYLTDEERRRFEDLTFTPEDSPLLLMAKDMFLIGCYCGLRYSDIDRLNNTNFETTDKGLKLIYKAKKTDKKDGLPLWALFSGKPEIIAQKYLNKGKKRLYRHNFHLQPYLLTQLICYFI